MKSVYLYFSRNGSRKAYFTLDPINNYPYVKKEIEFENFDKYIYEIFWENNSLLFTDKQKYIEMHDRLIKLEYFLNENIFDHNVISHYKKLLKIELKKYRGDYRIYFAKIKRKYKKYKNKLISEYFKNEMNNKDIYSKIKNVYGFDEKYPIDVEKYFKQLICSKTYKTYDYDFVGIPKIFFRFPKIFPIKTKKYIIVDEFC